MSDWNVDEEEFFKDDPDNPMHIYLDNYSRLDTPDLKRENQELTTRVWETGDKVNSRLVRALEGGNKERAKQFRKRMDIVVEYLYRKQAELRIKHADRRNK